MGRMYLKLDLGSKLSGWWSQLTFQNKNTPSATFKNNINIIGPHISKAGDPNGLWIMALYFHLELMFSFLVLKTYTCIWYMFCWGWLFKANTTK